MSESNQNFWVVVATACQGCGGSQSIALFREKPSENDRANVSRLIGGMSCIRISETEIEPGEILEAALDE